MATIDQVLVAALSFGPFGRWGLLLGQRGIVSLDVVQMLAGINHFHQIRVSIVLLGLLVGRVPHRPPPLHCTHRSSHIAPASDLV